MIESNTLNLHTYERVLRTMLGMGMIFSILMIQGPFDYITLLPLAGIYPCLTGIIGWDPLFYVTDFNPRKINNSGLKMDTQRGFDISYLAPKHA